MAVKKWMENRITLKPQEVYDLQYNTYDAPNCFSFLNPNETELLVAIKRLPTPTNYEYKIEPNSSGVYGSPNATRNIYIYNPLTSPINIIVQSCFDSEFSIDTLKSFTVNINENIADKIKGDGIIRGFHESLPTGNNTIGKVIINDNNFGEAMNNIANYVFTKYNSSNHETNIPNNNTSILAVNDHSTFYQNKIFYEKILKETKENYEFIQLFKTDMISNLDNHMKNIRNDLDTILTEIRLFKDSIHKNSYDNFVSELLGEYTTDIDITMNQDNKIKINFLVNDGDTEIVFYTINKEGVRNNLVLKKNECISNYEVFGFSEELIVTCGIAKRNENDIILFRLSSILYRKGTT